MKLTQLGSALAYAFAFFGRFRIQDTQNTINIDPTMMKLAEQGSSFSYDLAFMESDRTSQSVFIKIKALKQKIEEFRNQGRLLDAIGLANIVVNKERSLLGNDHYDLALSLYNLAELYREQ